RCLGLVLELQALDALRGDDAGGGLGPDADQPGPDAVDAADRPRLAQGLLPAPVLLQHVGGQVVELGSAPLALGGAAVLGVAASVLDAEQFLVALVEL